MFKHLTKIHSSLTIIRTSKNKNKNRTPVFYRITGIDYVGCLFLCFKNIFKKK